MKYQALITLDLVDAIKKERDLFYSVLENEKWIKISNLTTSWKATFEEGVTRSGAIKTIQQDLIKAKNKSKIKKVEYALQLDKETVIIESL